MSFKAHFGTLEQGIRALGEDPAQHPCDHYLQFLQELERWNRTYNLTGIREPEMMLTYHLLDSLSILPFIHGDRCLDVGTGAGLPGMILALARPETHWTLLDSKSKKIRFLHHILLELKPGNVEIVHSRVEQYHPQQDYTTIVTRALTTLAGFQQLTTHLKGEDCHLLAMKGPYPGQELPAIPADKVSIQKLLVPGIVSDRHLVIVR